MTIKKTALSLSLGLFLLTLEAHSEILRWPQLCLNGTLTVRNASNQNLRGWIQKFSSGDRIETEIAMRSFSKSDYQIKATSAEDRFSLMHFGSTSKVTAVFSCRDFVINAQSTEGGIVRYAKSDLNENKIWLQNLYSDENEVTIDYVDPFGKTVSSETLQLNSSEQKNFKTSLDPSSWQSLKISASQRLTSFALQSTGVQPALSIKPQPSDVDPTAAYFEIGPRDGAGDSFVARIYDPALIARARELVRHPELEKIVFAKVVKGHQGFNRNFNKAEKSFWSWSLSEVTNFADLGSTACNGVPQLVEDDVDFWVQNPGRICFWSYRIKKELSLQEMTQEAP